ncbi:hypothetical protein AMAG_03431 [Allomyces macrogynus ATCC 38327]|uniref:VHS domain-containing protein n=1 Tax=Allomyces macrogynus (strain ATCC 38327) TaxID=578462 RepID=A0A0L0S9F9_ALLM3|nr:hypothetical protein AMAG_03431 [Allomyces macrogynus ATCC 38327]|eukprot:KNE59087.1 hypothetical protein AMAG_03431 [Allomyces macrogynus ATCC 38327]
MAFSNLLSSTVQAVSEVARAIEAAGRDSPRSPIEGYIERACSPHRTDPDLALNLEICDLINAKGRTYPREAAMCLVRIISGRNQNSAMLALELLDICVKNCGYPFHLQLASKEFLNELVRRFPEKPPIFLPPTQRRILEFIQQWNVTLVQNGKYKRDLLHIADMYHLLLTKGYRFPGVAESAVAVMLQPNESLKSAEEMEEEEIAVKKAKLQELLRRASPADLEEANILMKELVGYDDHRVDYKAKEMEELAKFEQKANVLDSMLQAASVPGDLANDAVQELYTSCKAAQAKIVKLIEDRDDGNLDQLLALNDLLNRVIDRYMTIKRGRPAQQSQEPPAPISLISMSPTNSPQARATAAPASPPTNIMDDLLSLNLAGPMAPMSTGNVTPPGALGSIHLPIGNGSPARSNSPPPAYSWGSHVCRVPFFQQNASRAIMGLSWMVAAPKNVQVQVEPLSAQVLPPQATKGAYNRFRLEWPADMTAADAGKIKYRLAFKSNGVVIEESDVFKVMS